MTDPNQRHTVDNDERYLDENLSEQEKQSGRTRLPSPEEEGLEGGGRNQDRESVKQNPDRPDEAGDGDRRS